MKHPGAVLLGLTVGLLIPLPLSRPASPPSVPEPVTALRAWPIAKYVPDQSPRKLALLMTGGYLDQRHDRTILTPIEILKELHV